MTAYSAKGRLNRTECLLNALFHIYTVPWKKRESRGKVLVGNETKGAEEDKKMTGTQK